MDTKKTRNKTLFTFKSKRIVKFDFVVVDNVCCEGGFQFSFP